MYVALCTLLVYFYTSTYNQNEIIFALAFDDTFAFKIHIIVVCNSDFDWLNVWSILASTKAEVCCWQPQ